MKADPANPDRPLQCRMPGCRNRWAVDVKHGKVCSDHDRMLAHGDVQDSLTRPVRDTATAIPFRDAARPYAEVDDDRTEF